MWKGGSLFSLGIKPPLKQWGSYNHHYLPKDCHHLNWALAFVLMGARNPRVSVKSEENSSAQCPLSGRSHEARIELVLARFLIESQNSSGHGVFLDAKPSQKSWKHGPHWRYVSRRFTLHSAPDVQMACPVKQILGTTPEKLQRFRSEAAKAA